MIDQELCKVPANIGSAIVRGELSLQERIKLPGLRAVDVPLLEPREFILRSEFALHEFQNLLFGTLSIPNPNAEKYSTRWAISEAMSCHVEMCQAGEIG